MNVEAEQTQNEIMTVQKVTRRFGSGATEVVAVQDVSLTVASGEVVLIMGPSGSGKTTLLSMLGGLLKPSTGTIQIGRDEISALDERRLPEVRLKRIGFIFQDFNLLSALSSLDNVAIVAQLGACPGRKASSEPRGCWSSWGWTIASISCRKSCPAERSSGWLLLELWSTSRI